MRNQTEKTVGVIGGLGPQATLDFYAKLIQKSNATIDQDHLHVIINSNAKIPNRQEALAGKGPSCAPELIQSAVALQNSGSDFLVMVCNTAHAYEEHIKGAIEIPFISIIRESVNHCLNTVPNLKKVGILAATGCLEANLYQDRFDHAGVDCMTLNKEDQKRFMELIFEIKGNNLDFSVSMEMERLTKTLVANGAELILAACTEVPLVLQPSYLSVPLVNSTDVLVDATIRYAAPEHSHGRHFAYTSHEKGIVPQKQFISLIDNSLI